jgi:predicted  nucleic acid-binding Zn-ribbon protein
MKSSSVRRWRRRRVEINTNLNGEYWEVNEPTVTVNISQQTQTPVYSRELEVVILKRDMERLNRELDDILEENERLQGKLDEAYEDLTLLLTPSYNKRRE